jgi:hypothetical protein
MITPILVLPTVLTAICATVRSCWRSRDHKANVARVCSSFDSQAPGCASLDLASALAALHKPTSVHSLRKAIHPKN